MILTPLTKDNVNDVTLQRPGECLAPLHVYCLDPGMIEYVVKELGAAVNITSRPNRYTPLHLAASYASFAGCSKLIELEASINFVSATNKRPLDMLLDGRALQPPFAVLKTYKLLRSKGAKTRWQDEGQYRLVDCAEVLGPEHCIRAATTFVGVCRKYPHIKEMINKNVREIIGKMILQTASNGEWKHAEFALQRKRLKLE